MKTLAVIATLSFCGVARAQDEIDAALQQLADKLGSDEASAKLAALARSLTGRQAIRERIDFLLSARTGRIERDAIGIFEDHLFTRDEQGFLVARPGRAEDFKRLVRGVERAPLAMAGFNRRLDAMLERVGKGAEIDRRARAYWADPLFRTAFFHQRLDDLREQEEGALLDEVLAKTFEPRPGGGIRIAEALRQGAIDVANALRGRATAAANCEKSWLRLVLKETDDAVRTRAADSAVSRYVLGRLLRQAADGAEHPIGSVADIENSEEKTVTLAVPIAELVKDADLCRAFEARIAPALDQAVAGLEGGGDPEKDVAEFMKNPRTRAILAEHLFESRRGEAARLDKVMGEILADSFEGSGDILWVKKGRYRDEKGNESLEAFENEHRAVLAAFREARSGLDLIAERCADLQHARVFGSPAGTFVLQHEQSEVIESLVSVIRRDGLKTFTALYLEKKGEGFVVLPRRAERIDELARRAVEIQKEQDAGK